MESSHAFPSAPVTSDQVDRRTSDLLEVPPIRLVSEFSPDQVRARLGLFLDEAHINDALSRAAQAIGEDSGFAAGAYVVVFPDLAMEIPIEVREISDAPGTHAGFVYEPRSANEIVFDLTELYDDLADNLANSPRAEAISTMKDLSADGQEFALTDECCDSGAFMHLFEDGEYSHSYRHVSAAPPQAGVDSLAN